MVLDPEQYRLTESEHQAIFEAKIKPTLFAGTISSDRPVAIVFGGQPGAGKSAAVAAAENELESRGGSVLIEGDALRDYHPGYARLMLEDDSTAAFYTDRDSGRWVEKAIAHAKEQRVNLVIEGTMRNPDVVASTMKSLREAGYEIDARALAVTWQLSEQGILQRYENQKADRGVGRMTTPEAHQAAYDGMLHTLERIEREKLADRVTIYRRGNEAIYSNTLENGQWKHEPQARIAVEAERERPLTLVERKEHADGFDKIANLMSRSERQASAEEIHRIKILRHQAHALYSIERSRKPRQDETKHVQSQIDQLTQAEAGHPRTAASVDAIRTRIAAARDAAGRVVGQTDVGPQDTALTLIGFERYREAQIDRARRAFDQAHDAFWACGDVLPAIRAELEQHAQVEGVDPRGVLASALSDNRSNYAQRISTAIAASPEAQALEKSARHASRGLDEQLRCAHSAMPVAESDDCAPDS